MTPEGAALLNELWARGEAWRWLADVGLETGGQREWLQALEDAPPGSTSVWEISRQRGKSYAALLYAANKCVATPGAIVRYAALTGKSARAIVAPTMAAIAESMPEDMRPKAVDDAGQFRFPNGSTIVWAGTDAEQFERLRGPRAHLILLDESAFYADLERVEAALLPQLTTTGGKALYLSSPPETPAHPFLRRYRAACAVGRGRHATVHDNPRLGQEGVARIARAEAERLGLTLEQLEASTFWRREYLAEEVTEETRAAVPAWTRDRASRLVVEWARPALFDGYASADWGIAPDPKALLLAWYHPAQGLYVEQELELRGATISQWVARAKALEKETWGVNAWDGTLLGAPEWLKKLDTMPHYLAKAVRETNRRQPYLRVGDDDSEVLAELIESHGYLVLPTRKHDKHLSVDALNQLVIAERLHIHPRCVRLIEELYTTLWNKHRTEWERTDRDHGDLVDALVYLARNVNWHRAIEPQPPKPPWAEKERRSLGDTFGLVRT